MNNIVNGRARGTLIRAELAEIFQREIGLTSPDAARMVDQIIDTMLEAIVRGEHVKIANFGTFLVRDKVARVGRNPKTGVPAKITARKVVTFRPSAKLKQTLNGSHRGEDNQGEVYGIKSDFEGAIMRRAGIRATR